VRSIAFAFINSSPCGDGGRRERTEELQSCRSGTADPDRARKADRDVFMRSCGGAWATPPLPTAVAWALALASASASRPVPDPPMADWQLALARACSGAGPLSARSGRPWLNSSCYAAEDFSAGLLPCSRAVSGAGSEFSGTYTVDRSDVSAPVPRLMIAVTHRSGARREGGDRLGLGLSTSRARAIFIASSLSLLRYGAELESRLKIIRA
jgi:hypothetical protein